MNNVPEQPSKNRAVEGIMDLFLSIYHALEETQNCSIDIISRHSSALRPSPERHLLTSPPFREMRLCNQPTFGKSSRLPRHNHIGEPRSLLSARIVLLPNIKYGNMEASCRRMDAVQLPPPLTNCGGLGMSGVEKRKLPASTLMARSNFWPRHS